MITQLYQKYFQKSFSFLFPLLGLKRKSAFRPLQTYLRIKGVYRQEDLKLIVQYRNDKSNDAWNRFQQHFLLPHALLETCVESTDGQFMLYIFDLSSLEEDVRKFHLGQYSLLSTGAKGLISTYYGITSAEWAYIESFLYPEKYYEHYSKVLGVQEEVLKRGVELCPKWDQTKETLVVELPDNFVDQLSSL